MNKVLILILNISLIFCFVSPGASQQSPQQSKDDNRIDLPFPGQLMKREPAGNYLAPLVALKKREKEYLASEQWRGIFLDMMAYANSDVGNYAAALAYEDAQGAADEGNGEKSKPALEELKSSSPLDEYKPEKALDVIAKVADREQVIMINEYHHVPMHRAFTAELLPILYKKGFRYLAVEAVSDMDGELNQRGYPIYKTGGYTSEPVFGDMLRRAIKLGFKIVPYEYRGQCQPKADNKYFCLNERERVQAQNIYDRILKDDPKAKILVHAGMGHIQEDVYNKELSIMAAHFNAISKIDPFTIDQIEMIEHSAPEYEEAEYRYATAKNLIKEPTIFQSSSGKFWKRQPGQFASVDAQIFHPRVKYLSGSGGRPVWLQMDGERKPLALYGKVGVNQIAESFISPPPEGNEAAPFLFLVQAFYKNESDEAAVPVDQIVSENPKTAPVLMLPKGDFRIRVIDASGKIISENDVSFK